MFKRWKKKTLIFPSHLTFSCLSSLTLPKKAKELLRQPECHEEDSSGLTTPSLIKLTQVERMCNLRNRASLSPSQGEKGKSGSPAGSGTQCHCWKALANSSPGSPVLPAGAGCDGSGQELQWEEIKENFHVPVGLWAARGWQRHIVCPLGWVVWEIPNVYLGRVYLPMFSMGIFAVFNSLHTYKIGSTVFGKNSLQRVWIKYKSQPSFLLHSMALNKSSLDFFSWKKMKEFVEIRSGLRNLYDSLAITSHPESLRVTWITNLNSLSGQISVTFARDEPQVHENYTSSYINVCVCICMQGMCRGGWQYLPLGNWIDRLIFLIGFWIPVGPRGHGMSGWPK